MRGTLVVMSLVGGLVVVGALMLLQAVMRGFVPAWALPFSAWWGLIMAVPGLTVAVTQRRF
jgi:hypothetical protein